VNNKSDWLLYLCFNRLILCRLVDRRHDCNISIANTLQRYVRMICGLLQFGREMAIILSSLWPPYLARYGHQFCVNCRCHMALQVWNHNWLCYLLRARTAAVGFFVCLFETQNDRVICCAVELLETVAFLSVCVLAGFQSSAQV